MGQRIDGLCRTCCIRRSFQRPAVAEVRYTVPRRRIERECSPCANRQRGEGEKRGIRERSADFLAPDRGDAPKGIPLLFSKRFQFVDSPAAAFSGFAVQLAVHRNTSPNCQTWRIARVVFSWNYGLSHPDPDGAGIQLLRV